MKYQDLSVEAKEVALAEHTNNSADYDWSESVKEDWVERLEKCGIYTDVKSILWEGFWSQGDGASFTGSIDLKEFLEAHPDILDSNRALYITTVPFNGEAQCVWCPKLNRISHRYSHENTVALELDDEIDCYTEDEDEMYAFWNDAKEQIIDQCREYMKQIYKELEAEYEYITGEESLIEADRDYTEEGVLE
jgi:hypothetical protein